MSPAHRLRYGQLLLALASHPDLRTRREAWPALIQWSRGLEPLLAQAALDRLFTPDAPEWPWVTQALASICQDGQAVEHLVAAAEGLLQRAQEDPIEGSLHRDLPHRRRLHDLVARLDSLPFPSRRTLAPTFQAIEAALGQEPSLWKLTAQLGLSPFSWEGLEPLPALTALARRGDEEPSRIPWLRGLVCRHRSRGESPTPLQGLLPLAEALAASPSPTAHLFALDLVAEEGARSRWPREALSLLHRLRRDREGKVRFAALDVSSASEEGLAPMGYDHDRWK